MKLNKRLFLGLGSVVATAAPIVAVVSCGNETPTRTTIENKFLLESKAVLQEVQEKWWSMAIAAGGTSINPNDFFADTKIQESFDFVIRNHLMKDSMYVNKIANALMKTRGMQDAAKAVGKTPSQLAYSWNLLKPRINGDLTTDAIPNNAKKFIFENTAGLKEEVIKHAISVQFFLTQINKTDYKKIFMDENAAFSSTQAIIESADFNLINEGIEQHLFAKWTIALNKDGSSHFIGAADITSLADADKAMDVKTVTAGSVASFAKYSDRNKVLLDGLLPTTGLDKFGGFVSISSSKGKTGIYSQNLDGLKLAKDKADWTGYEYDGKLLYTNSTITPAGNLSEKLSVFPKNVNNVGLTRVLGLMPIYDGSKITYTGTDYASATGRKQLAMLLALNSKAYSKAEKYYIKKTNPVLLEIKSSVLKKIAIEHGFDFIKE